MSHTSQAARFTEFRQSLYGIFNNYADVLMNLIDASSSNITARSVVELSLNPAFERGYSALFKGISNLKASHKSPICKPLKAQESGSEQSEQAPKIRHEEQTNADSIATDQQCPSAKSTILKTPLLPHHDCQAEVETSHSTQSVCKGAQVPQQYSPAQYLPTNTLSQLSVAAHQHSSVPHSSVESQPASLPPQPANLPPQPAAMVEPLHSDTKDADQTKQQAQILLENQIQSLVVPYLPSLQKRPFHLFAIDVTSQPRQFSPTLQDRGFVYQPNAIRGNKPVTIGHQYSVMAYLPEKKGSFCPPWVVPLSTRRVTTSCDKELVGLQQIEGLIGNPEFDFKDQLSVQVMDSSYSKRDFLYKSAQHTNLVTAARARCDRTFYQKFQSAPGEKAKAGRPTWYGERFSLKEADTWHQPDQEEGTSFVSRRGKQYTVKIQAWQNMLMRGKDGIPMHKVPFTLLRICCFKPNGDSAFKNDLWLIIVGDRRDEITLLDLYQAYLQRFDIEHYFRFGKQRLLLTAFQTPEVEREENWWQIAQLAYTQLWLAAPLAEQLPRPWEKYLPRPEGQIPTPSMVQRDFGRIISQLGTPANPPKVRHKGIGRSKGETVSPRERHPVVKKGTKSQLKKAA